MSKYLLALLAALALVAGAYVVNTDSTPPQSRVLPNVNGLSLR
jgi:hypothetical protein